MKDHIEKFYVIVMCDRTNRHKLRVDVKHIDYIIFTTDASSNSLHKSTCLNVDSTVNRKLINIHLQLTDVICDFLTVNLHLIHGFKMESRKHCGLPIVTEKKESNHDRETFELNSICNNHFNRLTKNQ